MTDRGASARSDWARAGRLRAARPAAVIVAVFLLMTLATGLRLARERRYEAGERVTHAARIPSGALLRRAALSFGPLVADVFWIRAVQHYGRARLAGGGAGRYGQLQPLLDTATTLDPRFDAAYRTGAIFLAEPPPNGPGRSDQALALLARGARAMPERWEYPYDIGFIHYWWLRDYPAAASWFQRAGEVPGSPWWLPPLAANTLAIGGSRGSSRALWRQLQETSGNAWVRTEARRRLLQLEALDQIDRLVGEVGRFSRQEGRPPSAWQDLPVMGPDGVVPRDPAGHPYTLDSRSGAVSVSPRSPLFPLAGEPPPVALP